MSIAKQRKRPERACGEVKDALKDERSWFEGHRVYSKLPPGLVGTPVLIDKLTQILFKHIRRFLPEIKKASEKVD